MNYDYIPTTDCAALYEYQRSLEKKALFRFLSRAGYELLCGARKAVLRISTY